MTEFKVNDKVTISKGAEAYRNSLLSELVFTVTSVDKKNVGLLSKKLGNLKIVLPYDKAIVILNPYINKNQNENQSIKNK